MKIKAITEALRWLRLEQHRRVVITTHSMSSFQKVQKEYLYADWMDIIFSGPFDQINWIFSLRLAVVGNERADVLAEAAVIENNFGPTNSSPMYQRPSRTQQKTDVRVHIDPSEGKMS